ncbi:MAG TPA: hypothetical protein VH186_20435 [Chloroflexia bacterium]|nr:hypothetical protein [Chloroflexia bacterium]
MLTTSLKKRFCLLALLLALGLILAACGDSAPISPDQTDAGKATSQPQVGNQGGSSNSNSGSSGAAFSDIPVPGGFSLDGSGAGSFFGGNSNSKQSQYTKVDSKLYFGSLKTDEIVNFYKSEMAKRGWQNESWFGSSNGQFGHYTRNNGDTGVDFVVGPDTRGKAVSLILISRGEGKKVGNSGKVTPRPTTGGSEEEDNPTENNP